MYSRVLLVLSGAVFFGLRRLILGKPRTARRVCGTLYCYPRWLCRNDLSLWRLTERLWRHPHRLGLFKAPTRRAGLWLILICVGRDRGGSRQRGAWRPRLQLPGGQQLFGYRHELELHCLHLGCFGFRDFCHALGGSRPANNSQKIGLVVTSPH